jgi:hypothetical protein
LAYDVSACTTIDNPLTICRSPNVNINDNSTVNDIIPSIGTTAATITDVDVSVNLTHTFIGDLTLVVGHDGQTSTLYDETCSSQDNMTCSFSDGAASFNCGASTSGTAYAPGTPLSVFNGTSLSGPTQLSITDSATIDSGFWSDWCVTVSWALP